MATKVTSAKVKRTSTGGRKSDAAASSSAAAPSAAAALPMGKAMASTEKSVRDGAMQALAAYLAQSDVEPLSAAEMAKLWKGIFYCFWMSDKPRVQQALAQELADMLLAISAVEPAMQFLEGFLDTMVREWAGLDKWRVDKFLLLVRRFVNAAFCLLSRQGWSATMVQRWSDMLIKQPGGVLQANDVKSPDGLLYHISDIYLEELEKVAGDEGEGEAAIPVTALLQPFFAVAARCHANHHYERILRAVIVPWTGDCATRAQELSSRQRKPTKRQKRGSERAASVEADDDDEESECNYLYLIESAGKTPAALRKEAFDALFAIASRADSNAARRRRIYILCRDEGGLSDDDEDDD